MDEAAPTAPRLHGERVVLRAAEAADVAPLRGDPARPVGRPQVGHAQAWVGIMRRYERGPDGTFHDGLLMDLPRDEFKP